jgi:hypothetical protein
MTDMGGREAYLINWGLASRWRRVFVLPARRPVLPTFGWLLITGALCDLAIVGGLVVGAQVGVPALVGCLAAAVAMIRSPSRWQRWREERAAAPRARLSNARSSS